MADQIRGRLEDTSEGSLEHTKNIHQTTLSKLESLTILLQKKELSSFKTTGVSDEITKLQAHSKFVKKRWLPAEYTRHFRSISFNTICICSFCH